MPIGALLRSGPLVVCCRGGCFRVGRRGDRLTERALVGTRQGGGAIEGSLRVRRLGHALPVYCRARFVLRLKALCKGCGYALQPCCFDVAL